MTEVIDPQLDELVEILERTSIKSHKDIDQLLIQSHQFIHSTLFSGLPLDSLSDQQISERLIQHSQLVQDEFDSIQLKLSESTQSVTELVKKSQEEAQKLKPESEKLHEDFIKFEDGYLDHQESLKPKSDRHRTDFPGIKPKPALVDSISEQINWLKELKRLKLWLSILLDFRNRTNQLVDRSVKSSDPQSLASAPINQLDSLATELFEIVESYQYYKQLGQSNHAPHFNLFEYVNQVIRYSLNSLIEATSSHVSETLENELEWPQRNRAPLDFQSSSTTHILNSFKRAVNFQNKLNSRPDLISLSERKPERVDQNNLIWLPLHEGSILLKAILRPIILRFRFHFDGQRETNRLDKPEWYFNHILDRLVEHERFVKTEIQKLFELSGQTSIDVFYGLTIQLIKLVERKLKRTIPEILEMKPILAHTIEKAIEFDRAIRQKHFLSTGSDNSNNPSTPWLGTADSILSNHQWYNTWFEAEKRYADHVYLEIISSNDTWEINEDDQRPIGLNMTATNSALKIQDLVEQIKTKYEELPRLSYQVDFFIKIQLVVLEAYFQRINGVLDGFERNRLITVVGGESSRSKMNLGFKGLERLAKIYISCNWMLSAFRSWNDDLFYAELYEKLKRNKSLKMVEVEKLINSIESIEGLNVALFSPLTSRFEELSGRAESAIVKQVVQEISSELKPYFAKRWDLEPDSTEEQTRLKSEEIELSNEIIQPISIWKSRIGYLNQTIQPYTKSNKVIRRISKEVESKLIYSIIFEPFTIRSITLRGALQIRFDLLFGWLNFSSIQLNPPNLNSNRASTSLKVDKMFGKLLDCCKLLSFSSTDHDEDHIGSKKSQPLEFSDLVKTCFDDQLSDQDWKKFLKDRLNISYLTRAECQLILKRRPECWKV